VVLIIMITGMGEVRQKERGEKGMSTRYPVSRRNRSAERPAFAQGYGGQAERLRERAEEGKRRKGEEGERTPVSAYPPSLKLWRTNRSIGEKLV
jgi:hypothetical protein